MPHERVLPHPNGEPLVPVPMERIAIVGCGGSGKSHLDRRLGARLGITPAHLDALYCDNDWKPLEQETLPPCVTAGRCCSLTGIRMRAGPGTTPPARCRWL